MSVLNDHIAAVVMLCATILEDRTTVHANLGILEMDGIVKVKFIFPHVYCSVK